MNNIFSYVLFCRLSLNGLNGRSNISAILIGYDCCIVCLRANVYIRRKLGICHRSSYYCLGCGSNACRIGYGTDCDRSIVDNNNVSYNHSCAGSNLSNCYVIRGFLFGSSYRSFCHYIGSSLCYRSFYRSFYSILACLNFISGNREKYSSGRGSLLHGSLIGSYSFCASAGNNLRGVNILEDNGSTRTETRLNVGNYDILNGCSAIDEVLNFLDCDLTLFANFNSVSRKIICDFSMKSSLLLGKLTGNNSCAISVLANSGVKKTCALAYGCRLRIIGGISFVFRCIIFSKRADSTEFSTTANRFGIGLSSLVGSHLIGISEIISSIYRSNYRLCRIKHIALNYIVFNSSAGKSLSEFFFANFKDLRIGSINVAHSIRFNSTIVLVCGDIAARIKLGSGCLFNYSLDYSLNYLFLAIEILLDEIIEGTCYGSGSIALLLSFAYCGLALYYRASLFSLVGLSGSLCYYKVSLIAFNYYLFFCSNCRYSYILLIGRLLILGNSSAGDNYCSIEVLEDERNLGTKLSGIYLFICIRLRSLAYARRICLIGACSLCSLSRRASFLLGYLLGCLRLSLISFTLKSLIIGMCCFFCACKLSRFLCPICHLISSLGRKNCGFKCLSSFRKGCNILVFISFCTKHCFSSKLNRFSSVICSFSSGFCGSSSGFSCFLSGLYYSVCRVIIGQDYTTGRRYACSLICLMRLNCLCSLCLLKLFHGLIGLISARDGRIIGNAIGFCDSRYIFSMTVSLRDLFNCSLSLACDYSYGINILKDMRSKRTEIFYYRRCSVCDLGYGLSQSGGCGCNILLIGYRLIGCIGDALRSLLRCSGDSLSSSLLSDESLS